MLACANTANTHTVCVTSFQDSYTLTLLTSLKPLTNGFPHLLKTDASKHDESEKRGSSSCTTSCEEGMHVSHI